MLIEHDISHRISFISIGVESTDDLIRIRNTYLWVMRGEEDGDEKALNKRLAAEQEAYIKRFNAFLLNRDRFGLHARPDNLVDVGILQLQQMVKLTDAVTGILDVMRALVRQAFTQRYTSVSLLCHRLVFVLWRWIHRAPTPYRILSSSPVPVRRKRPRSSTSVVDTRMRLSQSGALDRKVTTLPMKTKKI